MGRKSRRKAERRRLRELAERLLNRTPGRSCGDCSECCEAVGVEELNKPNNEHCQHQCAAGCAIYGEHPPSCRTFRCFWLSGDFGVEHRPDKSRLVVHGATDESRAQVGCEHAFVNTLLPLDRMADTKGRRDLLDLFLHAIELPVVLLGIDGGRLLLPPSWPTVKNLPSDVLVRRGEE